MQELVGGSHHIDLIRFAFGAFLIDELVNRLIDGTVFENCIDNLKKRSAQMWRATLGNTAGFNIYVFGLVRWCVKSGKSSDCFAAVKTASITYLPLLWRLLAPLWANGANILFAPISAIS